MLNNNPDNFEKTLRFGCGGMVGVILGFSIVYHFIGTKWWMIFILIGIVVCGSLAMKYGDRFWDSLGDWIKWW